MQDRTGGERMLCPKCGVEQARAAECGHCGIVVARYRPRRYNWAPERPAVTFGAGFAVILLAIAAWMLWSAVTPIEAEPAVVEALPTPADVTQPADPSALDARWSRGAAGFKGAVAAQLDLRVPMVVYIHDRACLSCAQIQAELLNSPHVAAWMADDPRVEIVVDDGPDDHALAEKFGVTTLPALWVVRSNGQRKAVALTTGADGALPDVATFLAGLKDAAGR